MWDVPLLSLLFIIIVKKDDFWTCNRGFYISLRHTPSCLFTVVTGYGYTNEPTFHKVEVEMHAHEKTIFLAHGKKKKKRIACRAQFCKMCSKVNRCILINNENNHQLQPYNKYQKCLTEHSDLWWQVLIDFLHDVFNHPHL